MGTKKTGRKKIYFDDDQMYDSKQAIAIYNAEHSSPSKEYSNVGIKSIKEVSLNIKCINERQKLLKKSVSDKDKDIVISIGPAGTGKTYVALATALQCMKNNPHFSKLVMIKSLNITSKQEAIGFIKGTVEEKLAPYMMSFTSNLEKIVKSKEAVMAMTECGIFEYQPIAFVRGMTFTDCIVIIDEVQNLTLDVFKTIITRLGENCKMIFLGDKDQIDLPDKRKSCINIILKIFQNVGFVDIVNFLDDDSVRHKNMNEIIKLMEAAEQLENEMNKNTKSVVKKTVSNTVSEKKEDYEFDELQPIQ